jgi:cell division septal protein FtsQ
MAPDLSRRDFFTRGLAGRVAALLGGGVVAAPVQAAAGAPPSPAADISARDIRKTSREEVRAALGRIRARRRAR